MLAPAVVISAPKSAAPVSDAQRKQGMAEAPAVVQAAGLNCQVSDARFIGKSKDPKTKAETSFYEVACGSNMGFVLQAVTDAPPAAFSCIEMAPTAGQPAKEGSISCVLPGNADPKAQLAPLLATAGVQCLPEKARGIGQTKTNTILEVACQGGSGYVLIASAPLDTTKPAEAQNCLNFDESGGNVKCELTDRATRLAVVDNLAKSSNCVVKDRRFIGNSKDGSDFFEASCEDGKGYIFKVSKGQLAQTWGCGQAQGILGGCKLTDARQASAEQAATYTKLAQAAGSNCNVEKYAVFPPRPGSTDEAVELVCKDGSGAVGLFPATGKGQVVDCGHALALGFKCSQGSDRGFAALTADLKKHGKSTCTVSDARISGQTPKGTVMVEVACADGLKGYMIEYNTKPTVSAVGASGCAFAGGCQLKGNT
jgi:hypothetical protein